MTYDTESALTLDANDYIASADDAASASDDFADSAEETQESLFEFNAAGAAASGGIAAAGGAMQGAVSSSQDWRSSLARTSERTGIARDETEDLAASISDATFPMDDAVGAMETLSEQGVDSADDLEELSLAADGIADATDSSATSVAENLGPAITGLGGDLEDLPKMADAFTLAVENSTLETEDLGSTIERSSEDLEEMGLQADDAAGLIAAYANETGKSGSRASRDFGQAVNEADGDLDALLETTGLGEDALAEWGEEVEANQGITERHADAANESITTMDRLNARWDDAILKAGSLLGPIDALAPAMMGLGGAGVFLSTVNVSALIPSIGGVIAALTPLLPIILAVGVAITAAAVIWERDLFDIQDRTKSAVAFVTGLFGDLVDAVGNAIDLASYILFDWSPGDALDSAMDEVTDFKDDAVTAAVETGEEFVEGIHNEIMATPDRVRSVGSDVRESITDEFTGAKERGVEIFGNLSDEVTGIIDGLTDVPGEFLTDSWNAMIPSEVGIDAVTLPSREIDAGPLGSATVGGQTIFDGFSFGLPQLDTGGHIESDGLAELHEGEQVVQAAQVSSRGKVDSTGDADSIKTAIEDATRGDDVVALLETVVRLLADLDAGDVSQKDILNALDVARDRRRGRNPLGDN